MEIIGLSGYARSGKDLAATVFVEEFGFKRIAFADKLRDVLYALDPMVSADTWQNSMGISPVYLSDVILEHGWDGYKETRYGSEIRRLLQRLGTEAGRNILGDNLWVDAALTGHPEGARLVVTDVRFPNEYNAIRERGGDVWRIERDGVSPANAHVSETALDGYMFDTTIKNAGTKSEFKSTVRETYKYWKNLY